ncbi:hypothetical protein, partial [Streptomyces sundarbansensis]
MEQKKFIQEMKPQDKASSSYVHRKLQELPFVKLNTSKYRSLKENTLTAINSNKTLEITSKLKNIDKKDIDAVQTFIKQYKQEFKTRSSCLLHTLPLEDQDTFLYYPCTRLIPRVYRLMLNLSGSLLNN